MMSEQRFNVVIGSITTAARKVYEAVPIAEPWTHRQIENELTRLGVGLNTGVMMGCINSLIGAGLAVEVERGKFKRAPIRQKSAPKPPQPPLTLNHTTETPTMPATNAAAPAKPTALDTLAAIAQEAAALADQLRNLALKLENVALDVEDQITSKNASAERLRQLQALLREEVV